MSWLLFGLIAAAQSLPDLAEPVADIEPVVVTPDRSRLPDVTAPELLELPEIVRLSVTDAITAYIVPVDGVRKVDVTVYQHRGGVDFEGHVTPAHYAVGWLQDIATDNLSADEMAVYEDYWDINVWSGSGGLMRADTHLSVPLEDLDRGIELLVDVLTSPKYPGRDLKQYKAESVRSLLYESVNSPGTIARSLREMGWYSPNSPYGRRPDIAGIESLSRKALTRRHGEVLNSAPISVIVVGSVDPEQVVATLRTALGQIGQPGVESQRPGFAPPGDRRILAVDMPAAEQANILVRMPAPLLDAPERVAFSAVAWAYGGHFMSRINRNLREDKGITYGAGARYSPGWRVATFDIGVDVPADKVGVAMAEIEAELAKMAQSGVTTSELSAKALEDVGWYNQILQTSNSASGFYTSLVLNDEGPQDVRARIETLQALTPEQTQAASQAWLGEESARLWAVVGPRSVIESQLEALDLEIEWIDPSDAILGNFE